MPTPTYHCTNCNAQLDHGARWCRSCGVGTGGVQHSFEGDVAVATAHQGQHLAPANSPTSHTGQAMKTSLGLRKTRWRVTATTYGGPTKVALTILFFLPLVLFLALLIPLSLIYFPMWALVMVGTMFWWMGLGPILVSMWRVGRVDGETGPPSARAVPGEAPPT